MKTILSMLAAVGLAACTMNDTPVSTRPEPVTAQDQAAINLAVVDRLKDPATAQLRGVQVFGLSNGDRAICGEVNGRNSFGGYVGFQPFYIRTRAGQVVTFEVALPQYERTGEDIRADCATAASGQIMVDGSL